MALLMTKNIHLQILKNNISCNICTLTCSTSEGDALSGDALDFREFLLKVITTKTRQPRQIFLKLPFDIIFVL